MAKRQATNWAAHGDRIVELYLSGLSVRELIPIFKNESGVEYPSGTLTNFLGTRGVLRSKIEARKLALAKAIRICELCGDKHVPRNWNQRWCDGCTGVGKYTRRVRNHGVPAMVIERMFEEQERRCKLCDREFVNCLNTKDRKTLFVDHDHGTQMIRGLLCPRCNNGMSYVDDQEWLSRAMKYRQDSMDRTDLIRVDPPRVRRYVRNKPIVLVTEDQTESR